MSKLSRKQVTAALAAVGSLIGVLAAATALFDWFGEKVHPPPTPPPAEIDARITRVELRSRRESLFEYMREVNQPTSEYTEDELNEPGLVFVVRMRVQGRLGKLLGLGWSLIGARSGQRLKGPAYNWEPFWFKPSGPSQARTWPVWVPYPPRKGKFVLRVALLDEHRQPLDQVESKRFVLARSLAPVSSGRVVEDHPEGRA